MIGQRRKTETTVDHVKSAELLAELTSVVPAALLLASMFQRDEHGSRRIPILLEQLKVHVTDSEFDSHSGDRHLVFRIELEYGSGVTRMKWVIHRTLRDFANLHLKYKLHIGTKKYIQLRGSDSGNTLPRFPRGAFPYLRNMRGLESDTEDEEDDGGDETAAEAASGNERAMKKKKRRSFGGISRRQSSFTAEEVGSVAGTGDQAGPVAKRDSYPELAKADSVPHVSAGQQSTVQIP
jgi:phospholipase D1/2